ncbi:hypothetical protein ACGFW5_29590 [Streptomyces sp. NPDC048416]|uniref:hypothetical protein n=1 Tax=Streptomyces sp. NPDC048416 TaxID=3365546 RepID=UPI003714001D
MTSNPDAVRARAAAVFDLDARLPARVFRELADDAVFCEFDYLLTPDAWPALVALAGLHGDQRVDLVVVEGHGIAESALSLSVEATADDYWAEIGFHEGRDFVDSIAIMTQTVVLTGPSGRWGCWGERDPEVAVVRGFPDEAARHEWSVRYGPFVDAAGALEFWLPVTFPGRSVPDAYAAELTANYGASPQSDQGSPSSPPSR